MRIRRFMPVLALLAAVVTAAGAGAATLGDSGAAQVATPLANATSVSLPVLPRTTPGTCPIPVATNVSLLIPPKGKGDNCVAPVEWMRRNHMQLLFDERNRVVHGGVRISNHSIEACVECHAVAGADGRAVPISDPNHFCRSCHDYAAVAIDCFDCHASQPQGPAGTAAYLDAAGKVVSLSDYLNGRVRAPQPVGKAGRSGMSADVAALARYADGLTLSSGVDDKTHHLAGDTAVAALSRYLNGLAP